MKKTLILSCAVMLCTLIPLVSCEGNGQKEEPSQETTPTTYNNPVSNLILPDPSVIRDSDGTFYLYASDESVKGLPIVKSKDLVNWSQSGQVFSGAARPRLDGSSDGNLWAPEIARIGNKYVLYYSYTPKDFSGKEWQWGIGAATADRPTGPWTDKGKVFLGGEIGVQCSIDPCFYAENGKNYLIWGSYFGIWAIELSADGLSVRDGAEKVHLAGTDGYGLEGAMIHKKDGKYYLFVSEGGTGYNDHYKLGCARADQLLGPYLNKAGKDVKTAPVDFFLSAGNGFISPGHCSQILTDDKGQDWVLYHAYVQNEQDKGRRLMLSNLSWTGGWPSVAGGVPAKSRQIPYWK
jgi:arabinan endo-1,5-alpha-L-arabinosidase